MNSAILVTSTQVDEDEASTQSSFVDQPTTPACLAKSIRRHGGGDKRSQSSAKSGEGSVAHTPSGSSNTGRSARESDE